MKLLRVITRLVFVGRPYALRKQRHLNQVLARVPLELTKLFGEGPIERDFVFAGHIKIDIVRNTCVLPHVIQLVGLDFFNHIFPLCRKNAGNGKLTPPLRCGLQALARRARTEPMEARARIEDAAKRTFTELI